MTYFQARTDLALEAREYVENSNKEVRGVEVEEYENEAVLPYGFTNTSIGSGHLNKNGHAMIAESLYEIIKEAE